MKYFKIIGLILLIAGVGIISWTLISSYNIFTAKAEAPAVFKIETEKAAASVKQTTPTTQAEMQREMERMVGEQIKEFLPLDVIPKMLNLAVWSMLAFILIFGGTQISGLGIKLIRPIK